MQNVYSNYKEYVCKVVVLMVSHVWHLSEAARPISPLVSLDMCVDIFRKTTFSDGMKRAAECGYPDGWERIKSFLSDRIMEHSASMEAQCIEHLWPFMEARIELDAPPPPADKFGCWTYVQRGSRAILHFDNVYAPESPFVERRKDCVCDLLALLIEARKSGMMEVGTGTWLVQFPPFLAFFPNTFAQNICNVRPLGNGWGTWGQYMNRSRGFHSQNAAILRATGQHPYPMSGSWCGVDEAIRWLEHILLGEA